MRLYRICRSAHHELDGEGARLYGGRWNSPGLSVVYTSSTLALAALEYLVHADAELVPADLVAVTIDVPDDASIETADVRSLPRGWNRVPEHPACTEIGDAWLRAGRSLGLRVPSAPVPEELNVLLNPKHADAVRVSVVRERRFHFDPRLLA